MRIAMACLMLTLTAACGAGMPGLAPENGDADAPAMSLTARPGAQSSGPGFLAGLFGGNRAAQTTEASLPAADAPEGDIAFGTRLPYGRIATICGVETGKLGTRIARYPERRPRYQLYDSAPDSTGPRAFYITGFDDGCARQFTAALAVFGSVEMHEQLRYGLPAEVQPYSDTDKAYETLKRRVCNKPRRKPCGRRIGTMAKDTVFVSVYERFGGNSQWMNLLLHGGKLVAQDSKTGA